MQKSKMTMQRPDLSVSKTNQDKATRIIDVLIRGLTQQVKKDSKSFSTFASVSRMVRKDSSDPTDKHIFELIKRIDKDKMHSQVALQLSELATQRLQNSQRTLVIKMIPYFVALVGLLVLLPLIAFTRPFALDNPVLQRYLFGLVIVLPFMFWGLRRRKSAKLDMISMNILLQATAAYASAKMQGRGQVAAIQNLAEMRRRAKNLENKAKDTKSAK